MKPEENYSMYMLVKDWGAQSNLPGVDNSKLIQTTPMVIREDGYEWPTKPLTKRQWWLWYYLALFCSWIGRD